MAEEELNVVVIEDNFYRDSFGRVIFIISCICLSIVFLVGISVYIFINRPPPITFRVADEWRVLAPVPVQQPYLSEADMLQWVSDVIPNVFDMDFLHIDEQLANAKQYFTENGYEVFLNQLNNYAPKDLMLSGKLFSHGEPTRAPVILNQGILTGRYAWMVQIPINISYAGLRNVPVASLMLQVLVVRTDTTNNLNGVLIDNIIVDQGNKLTGTGK